MIKAWKAIIDTNGHYARPDLVGLSVTNHRPSQQAEGTGDFVAAPYRFEVLSGVGHFAADQVPDRVSELLLQHIAAHPV
jgi:hypothetical protein